ncbi:hypothetical protein E1A91_A05G191400v1 [Gossypium mustelinum]|uniref:Myb/SANT-like domain-containing protein n=1 Tax=Gossypium mustelinum TaxID=34275 RepID=A0A5D2Z708_GOSMU|nr:hypothetical protein E1A91_A05G191400v1 [Gossypium mustelinum]
MDDVLIDALLHQQSLGNRIDRVFTTMPYENMANELHEKIGIPIENGLSGFAWSPDTKMWTAKPELWKALAKSKPDSMKWMNTRIANYDKLLMLFAKDTEKRDGAIGGHLGGSIGGRVFDGIPLQDVVGASMEEKDTNDTTERGQPRVYSGQEVFAELVNIGVEI